MEYIIPAVVVILLLFFVARELMCWYWKINDIVKNQQIQIEQMDAIIDELTIQNRQLKHIVDKTTKTENEESTP